VYTLLGGETLTLTEMIVIMGVVCMVMAQIPTMHALRSASCNSYTYTLAYIFKYVSHSANRDCMYHYIDILYIICIYTTYTLAVSHGLAERHRLVLLSVHRP